MGTLGEPVDKPFDGEVLQEFIERPGGILGLIERRKRGQADYVLIMFYPDADVGERCP